MQFSAPTAWPIGPSGLVMAKVRTPICLSFFTASRTSGVVPDSEAVSTTERSVMRLWPITFHSAAWTRYTSRSLSPNLFMRYSSCMSSSQVPPTPIRNTAS